MTSTWLAPGVEDLQVRKGANKWNGKRVCATDRRRASGPSSYLVEHGREAVDLAPLTCHEPRFVGTVNETLRSSKSPYLIVGEKEKVRAFTA